jgi:hypothetical protein
MKLRKLLSDWLLVRLDTRKETTPGGIIRVTEQPVWTGVVEMAGPGRRYTDKFIPMDPDIVGQRIAFLSAATDGHQTGMSLLRYLDKEHRLVRMSDILFVVNEQMKITKDDRYFDR